MGFDLFRLFLLTVTYYTPFTDKKYCIREISQLFIDGGCVWQKFAQVLAMNDDLIGKELATELQKLTFDCPIHEDDYTIRVIKDAFGEKYDTTKMKLIGSGTISQVYKIPLTTLNKNDFDEKVVAIKVMHPNAKKEILGAIEYYESIKQSYLFPSKYKNVCQLFFTGLKKQTDMETEFTNGRKFKSLFPKNTVFIIPEMIEKSKKCLVMEYYPSILAVNCLQKNVHKEVIMKLINAIFYMNYESMLNGSILHLDLHTGNYGLHIPNRKNSTLEEQLQNMRVVVYDFGQMCDISSFDKLRLQNGILNFIQKNANNFCNSFFKNNKNEFMNYCNIKKIKDNGNKEYFLKIMFKYINYVLTNDVTLDTNEKNILICYSKLLGNLTLEHNLYKKYPEMKKEEADCETYLSGIQSEFSEYDDFPLLKTLLGKKGIE
jgi:predicted unusual protein kinase regulating ubiquinone biosynthesis (AarF/ABC1/UbiB family)